MPYVNNSRRAFLDLIPPHRAVGTESSDYALSKNMHFEFKIASVGYFQSCEYGDINFVSSIGSPKMITVRFSSAMLQTNDCLPAS